MKAAYLDPLHHQHSHLAPRISFAARGIRRTCNKATNYLGCGVVHILLSSLSLCLSPSSLGYSDDYLTHQPTNHQMEDGIELGLEGLDHAVQYADKLPSVITSPKLPHFGRRRSQDKSRSKSKDYNNHNEDYNDDDRYQEPPPSANSSRRRSLSSQYYDSRRGDDNYVHQPSISSPRSGGDGLRREEAITFPRSRRDTLSPRDSRYGTRPRSSSAYYDDEVSALYIYFPHLIIIIIT